MSLSTIISSAILDIPFSPKLVDVIPSFIFPLLLMLLSFAKFIIKPSKSLLYRRAIFITSVLSNDFLSSVNTLQQTEFKSCISTSSFPFIPFVIAEAVSTSIILSLVLL